MSTLMLPQLLFKHQRQLFMSSQRYQRGPFVKPKRSYEERNRVIMNAWSSQRLKLAEPSGKPNHWKITAPSPDPKIVKQERKLPSLVESALPYQSYTNESQTAIQKFGTYYDPLFNPHLYENRHRVDPHEEPFNAIYSDSKSEGAKEYTGVRNITTPELWEYVERLARIKIAPEPKRRKVGEQPTAMPSGYIPPPETPPDLPYFVPRTRNFLLPVYYKVHSDPEQCHTMVKQVTGDLWKLEEDLRTHLEGLSNSKKRILTSVHETDERVLFRGRHIQEVVAWLHAQGF